MDDIIPPSSEPCVASSTTDLDFDALVEDGVYEVYGPPVKRSRLSTTPSDPAPFDLHVSFDQQRTSDSEEQLKSLSATTRSVVVTDSNPSLTSTPSNDVPVVGLTPPTNPSVRVPCHRVPRTPSRIILMTIRM